MCSETCLSVVLQIPDLFYRIAYGHDLLCFLLGDLDIKFLLNPHNNLEYIQRICSQIVHKCGVHGDLILIHVQDIMRTGEDIPAVREEVGVLEAVREITKKHIGMTAVVDDQGHVTGIFTEGDLRRLIERLGDIRPCVMKDVMIRNPKTIRAQELAASAVKLLDTFHCNQLLVVDEDNRLIGALHLHDLMGAKVL